MARTSPAIAEARLRRFVTEDMAPGETRLPDERSLARQLGCSRETLRKALEVLEAEGLLWRHVGQGTFLGRRPLHLPIRETLLVEGATPGDVMAARLLLEPVVAAEAARHAGREEVALLRRRVSEGRGARALSDCEAADDAFHRAMATTSRNPVLIGFLSFLSGARRRVAWQREWDRTYRRVGVEEFRTLHSDQHDAVVQAVAEASPDRAEAAMRRHLRTIEAAMRPAPGP